jgi:hypothetical protein
VCPDWHCSISGTGAVALFFSPAGNPPEEYIDNAQIRAMKVIGRFGFAWARYGEISPRSRSNDLPQIIKAKPPPRR